MIYPGFRGRGDVVDFERGYMGNITNRNLALKRASHSKTMGCTSNLGGDLSIHPLGGGGWINHCIMYCTISTCVNYALQMLIWRIIVIYIVV